MKTIEDLQKRIETLEKQIKEIQNNKSHLFGATQESVGSSTSDLILKTRGKVKIQWGNKFIDLLKDGNINVNTNFIFKVPNKDAIKNKQGIYITDNQEVYLKLQSEEPVNLIGEIGTTYVSFLELQNTTSDNKYIALQNVGFLYPDVASVTEDSLKNGIIYIESEQKLYCIKDGKLSEYTFKFPNPFTEQFIISKADENFGALLIKGTGINNSIAFDSFYIYNTTSESKMDSKLPLIINIKDKNIVTFESLQTIFKNNVISNTFQSPNANSNYGFKLYMINGKSILEVDQVIERDGSSSVIPLYPELWLQNVNVIKSIDFDEDSGDYVMQFSYNHSYKENDMLRFYVIQEEENNEEEVSEENEENENEENENENNNYSEALKYVPIDIQVNKVLSETSISFTSSETLDNLSNVLIFSVNSGAIRVKDNIDIIIDNNIHSRIGNISELSDFNYGIYSENASFKEVKYTSNYNLDPTDNSRNLASTEWVKQQLIDLLPKGCITMFDGSTNIPNGWAICDGNNGTPNLIDKFIKASNVSGNTGEITGDSTITDVQLEYYTLIFIMKI